MSEKNFDERMKLFAKDAEEVSKKVRQFFSANAEEIRETAKGLVDYLADNKIQLEVGLYALIVNVLIGCKEAEIDYKELIMMIGSLMKATEICYQMEGDKTYKKVNPGPTTLN